MDQLWTGKGHLPDSITLFVEFDIAELTCVQSRSLFDSLNPLTPKDLYMSSTAQLTSKHCVLYIYSANVGTEYFKHALYSPVFFSPKCSLFHNANLFGSCIIHILHTGCAEIKR